MFVMQLEGGTPICEQLCARITELISSGMLSEGEKLPAVREVAKSLGINPNTVQKAYSLLEKDGLIYSIPAKGSYVSKTEQTARIIHDNALLQLEAALSGALAAGVTEREIAEITEKLKGGGSK